MAKRNAKELIPNEVQSKAIQDWRNLAQQVKAYKDSEYQFRTWLAVNLGFDITKVEGTEWVDLPDGSKLKLVKKQAYTCTNENQEAEKLNAAIWEATGDPALIQELIRWKPEIGTKALKRLYELLPTLPEEQRNNIKTLLAAAITVKPNLPELEYVESSEAESKT